MSHYEAVLLNPNSGARMDIRQKCGHKHRTEHGAESCAAQLWGANRAAAVALVGNDIYKIQDSDSYLLMLAGRGMG